MVDAERFGERYAASGAEVTRAVELAALGSDYGATGYLTRDQADDLGRRLDLRPGRVLLDIGAGCGWPGLYLARTSGCSVISADPVSEGAVTAQERIAVDGLESRATAVIAMGEQLPIHTGSIDAVVHGDVLC